MSKARIERDSLGEIEVPGDALYGAQTMRAVHNFRVSGLKPYRAFVWGMAVIKQAAALVHMDLGMLDGKRGKAIVEAAQEVVAQPLAAVIAAADPLYFICSLNCSSKSGKSSKL